MSRRLNRGIWLLRLFTMCASLAGVLFAIDHFHTHKISIEPITGAYAEEGISATVQTESDRTSPAAKTTDPIDKLNSDR